MHRGFGNMSRSALAVLVAVLLVASVAAPLACSDLYAEEASGTTDTGDGSTDTDGSSTDEESTDTDGDSTDSTDEESTGDGTTDTGDESTDGDSTDGESTDGDSTDDDTTGDETSDGEEESDEPYSITIYGYVSNISDEGGNSPLSGVKVGLLDSMGNSLSTCTTGSDGRFEFTYSSADGATYLSFTYAGYTVRTIPNGGMTLYDDSVVKFDLSYLTADEDGAYALSGDGSSASAFGMAATTGVLYGYVTGGGDYLEGATITAESESGRIYTAVTDSTGYFEVTVEYGDYTISVSCGGFQYLSGVSASTGSQVTITLTANDTSLFFGIDTPHTMMILGIAVIVVMLVLLLTLLRRSKEPDSEITVVDDLAGMEKEGGDQGDDLRGP